MGGDPRPERRILVADDDRDVLGLVSSRLERAEFEVMTASNGDEALSKALAHKPEVAILDVVMPGRSGHDVTRALRGNSLTEDMQVILLSARDRHHDIVRGFEAGADDYITKPFRGKDLEAHVLSAFQRLAEIGGVDAAVLLGQDAHDANVTQQMQDLLLAAVSEREGDLRGHVDDVARLAVPVGVRLGMSELQLRVLRYAAHLHDVGKLGVPDAVLDKPGALSDDEWRLMRKHTLIGERILRAAPAMAQVGAVVRSCHERWDGAGYPDGLSGEDIPLAARIIFVCDAFSAMTSRRRYAEPRSGREALRELCACAGAAFDPRVVDAFCAEASASGWDA